MTRKRGKLSNDEMKFIRENCFDLSVEDIAKHINRNVEPVKKYIDKQNLKARGLTTHEHLLNELRGREYYKLLPQQLTDGELKFFEHQWISYVLQFQEDVTHTEEMQILEVIRTEILINRSMAERQQTQQMLTDMQERIDEETMKDSDERNPDIIAALYTQIGALMGSRSAYTNEHDKLVTKKDQALKQLKGTRDQRKQHAEDAKTNFTAWMRQLDNEDARRREGYDMEVHKVAADKARERMAELHTFEDDTVDPLLLNSETVENVEGDDHEE